MKFDNGQARVLELRKELAHNAVEFNKALKEEGPKVRERAEGDPVTLALIDAAEAGAASTIRVHEAELQVLAEAVNGGVSLETLAAYDAAAGEHAAKMAAHVAAHAAAVESVEA